MIRINNIVISLNKNWRWLTEGVKHLISELLPYISSSYRNMCGGGGEVWVVWWGGGGGLEEFPPLIIPAPHWYSAGAFVSMDREMKQIKSMFNSSIDRPDDENSLTHTHTHTHAQHVW